jgi:hypothetical protein
MSGEVQEILENGELRPITPVEAEFLRLYFKTGSVPDAAMQSGLYKVKQGSKRSSEKISAASKGAKALRLLQPQLQDMMAQAGLSPMEILKPLKEGLSATEVVIISKTTKSGIGKDAIVTREDTAITKPAYIARAKYVEMGLKVHQILVNVPSSINVKAEANAGAVAAASSRSGDLKGKSVEELREIMDGENRARAAAGRFRKGA